MISGMRGLARARPGERAGGGPARPIRRSERCGSVRRSSIPDDHRHLLALVERRIVCSCEACWAMRAGEGDYRPTGNRTVWLPDLDVPDDLWASFQIPIGLAFFMHSTVTSCVVAMYPSPAGPPRSELHFETWRRMCRAQPGARRPRVRHRGTDRQPADRAADVRDRPDRPLLRADGRDQGAPGRASRAGRASARRCRSSSSSCGARRSTV